MWRLAGYLRWPGVRAALSLVVAGVVLAQLMTHRANTEAMRVQLAHGVAASAWYMSETLYEAQRFALSVAHYLDERQPKDEVLLRFELLWSRVDVLLNLDRGGLVAEAAQGSRARGDLAWIDARIRDLGRDDRGAWHEIEHRAMDLAADLRRIWIREVAAQRYDLLSRDIAELRTAQTRVEVAIAVALLALLAHLGGELFMAYRALEREAALRLEAMAGRRARSEFLKTVSHDLRTPLNGILGLSALLSCDPESARRQTLVSGIQKSGALLLRRVESMLDFVQILSGAYELREGDVSLGDLADAAQSSAAEEAKAKGVSIETFCTPGRDSLVTTDCEAITTALREIVDNAVKFTERGKVSIYLYCDGRTLCGSRLRIIVEDSGIGFQGTEAKRLVNVLASGHPAPKRSQDGPGIGLALAHGIVDLLGGRMGAGASASGGARVWMHVTVGVPGVGFGALRAQHMGRRAA